MTNGEKIKELFPSINFGTLANEDMIVNRDYSNNDDMQVYIPIRVWNAEYKESTPKVDGEYISRSEALDCINWAFSFSRAYELISKLPVVHPKTRTAKWKKIGIIMEGRKYAKDECDCAEAYSCDYCGWQTYLKTKYCPNCACEMEEENEQSI